MKIFRFPVMAGNKVKTFFEVMASSRFEALLRMTDVWMNTPEPWSFGEPEEVTGGE